MHTLRIYFLFYEMNSKCEQQHESRKKQKEFLKFLGEWPYFSPIALEPVAQ